MKWTPFWVVMSMKLHQINSTSSRLWLQLEVFENWDSRHHGIPQPDRFQVIELVGIKKLLTLPIFPIYWTRQWISALPRTPDHCDATVEKCQSLHLCNFPKYLASLFSFGILSKSPDLIISINIFLIPQGMALGQAWGVLIEDRPLRRTRRARC